MKYLLFAYTFSLFLALLPLSNAVATGHNPFLEMLGKRYADYHKDYTNIVDELFNGDSLDRAKLNCYLSEAADADNTSEWILNAKLVSTHIRAFESRQGRYTFSSELPAEEMAKDFLNIAREAGRKGLRFIKVKALFDAAETYRIYMQEYEHAFSQYLAVAAELETMTTEEFPPRPFMYLELASLYYTFREYGEAMVYYRKILDDQNTAELYHVHYTAINELGLCYRYDTQDYERSDSCFIKLIEWTRPLPQLWRDTWEGIAQSNIGYNYYLRGKPDEALAWFIPAIEKITRPNDYPFLSISATRIANIYMDKLDAVGAKKYIDKALDYHHLSGIPDKRSDLYQIMFRYYAGIDDGHRAVAYHDSTLMAQRRENDAFSGLVLRRVEQQLRLADTKKHKEELYLAFAVLTVILAFLILTLLLYRRQRNAYRELVRHNQNWAGIAAPPQQMEDADKVAALVPTENDKEIMATVEKHIAEGELYKRPDLTLDILATETGINRYHLSTVLNRCTGKNFSAYVNEYRIKEAIRILSAPDSAKLTIDAVAYDSGFNDRTSFYRSFKKITGLSPGDFRRNIFRD